MSTEQKQRASVSQWQAINRLLEFIIVSSYDGEEPGGLRGREKGTASLSAGFTSLLASAVTSISVSLLLICLFHREISEPSINHVYEWTNEWKIIQNTRNCDSVLWFTEQWYDLYHTMHQSLPSERSCVHFFFHQEGECLLQLLNVIVHKISSKMSAIVLKAEAGKCTCHNKQSC